MDLSYLFLSLDGRIGRARFWLGTVVLAIVSLVATYLIVALVGVSQAAIAFSAAVPSRSPTRPTRSWRSASKTATSQGFLRFSS